MDGEVRTEENQCNTEKDRDRRVNRHTCGILIALYPCGTVIFFDEIFGCESKSQVYAIVLEWLATIAKDKRPSTILYDDACHLVHIIKKIAQVYPNEYTSHFASMKCLIDFMHFRNHKGEKCKTDCNPYDHEELKTVNSQVCEQFFGRSNKYRQVRSMNRESFILFWTYILDLNNLRREDKLRNLANPLSEKRMEVIIDEITGLFSNLSLSVPEVSTDSHAAGVTGKPVEPQETLTSAQQSCSHAAGVTGKPVEPQETLTAAQQSCSCEPRSKCKSKKCLCVVNRIKCTDLCHSVKKSKTAKCENK